MRRRRCALLLYKFPIIHMDIKDVKSPRTTESKKKPKHMSMRYKIQFEWKIVFSKSARFFKCFLLMVFLLEISARMKKIYAVDWENLIILRGRHQKQNILKQCLYFCASFSRVIFLLARREEWRFFAAQCVWAYYQEKTQRQNSSKMCAFIFWGSAQRFCERAVTFIIII